MNKRFMKVITLILSCLLLIGAAVGITVAAEDNAPAVSIEKKNVAYEGAIQLVYLVTANNLPEGAVPAIRFEANNKDAYVKTAAGTVTLSEVEYDAIYSNGIVAKEYRLALKSTPGYVLNGEFIEAGEAENFSAYDYAMTRFDGTYSDAQFNLYKALLDYGAAVQTVLDYNDESVLALGGWIDEYYNTTITNEATGEVLTYKRGKTAPDANFVADRFADGKVFLGLYEGEELATASEGWYKYTVKPGTAAKNIVAKFADGTNPYNQFTGLTALPALVAGVAGKEAAFVTDPSTAGVRYITGADDALNFVQNGAADGDSLRATLNTVNNQVSKIVYDFDIRVEYANSLRTQFLYLKYFSNKSASSQAPYTGSALQFQDTNESDNIFEIAGVGTFNYNEWINIRLEFVKAPGEYGTRVYKYFNGVVDTNEVKEGDEVVGYVDYSVLDAHSSPYLHFETRYNQSAANGAKSNVSYSIDNFRVDESAACTEHEFVDITGAYFKVSDATCSTPTTYKKSCNICGAAGTETFSVGETIPHNYQNVPYAYAIKTQATDKSPAVYYKSCALCKSVNEEVTFTFGKTEPYYNGVPTTPKANGFNVDAFDTDTSADIGIFLMNEGDNYFVRYHDDSTSQKSIHIYAPVTVDGVTTYYYQHDLRIDGFTDIRDGNWPITIKLIDPLKTTKPAGEANSRAFDIFAREGDTHAAFALGGKDTAADNYKFGTWATITYKLVKGEEVSEGCFKWTVTLYVDGVEAASTTCNSMTIPQVRYESRYAGTNSNKNACNMDYDNVVSYYEHTCDGSVTCVANPCTVCGYVELTGEYTAHNYFYQNSAANLATPATATTPATYFVKCQDCGLATGETFTDGYLVHDYDDGTLPSYYNGGANVLNTDDGAGGYRQIITDGDNKFFRLGKYSPETVVNADKKLNSENIVYWDLPIGEGIIANTLTFDLRWNGGNIASSDSGAGFVKVYGPGVANNTNTTYAGTSTSCSGTNKPLNIFGTQLQVGVWYKIVARVVYNENGKSTMTFDVYDAEGNLVKSGWGLTSSGWICKMTIHPRGGWNDLSYDYDNAYLVTEHNCNDNAAAIANNANLKGETASGAEFYKSCAVCGRVVPGDAVVNGGVYATDVKPAIDGATLLNKPLISAPETDANNDGIGDGKYVIPQSETVTNIKGEEVENTFLRVVQNNVGDGNKFAFTKTVEEGKNTYVVEFDFRWQGMTAAPGLGSASYDDTVAPFYNCVIGGNNGNYGRTSSDGKTVDWHGVKMNVGEWHKFTYTFIYNEDAQNYTVNVAIDGVEKQSKTGSQIGFSWELRWSSAYCFMFDVDNFTYTAK